MTRLSAVALVLALVGDLTAQQLPTAIPQTKFVSGQNVTVVPVRRVASPFSSGATGLELA